MLIEGLRQSLRSLRPVQRQTAWSDYTSTSTYAQDATRVKEQFVRDALAGWQPHSVLDVGCNTGHYSMIAAAAGAAVVALDYDPEVVNAVFRGTSGNANSILPLVVNLAWPSPAMGWNCAETTSFLDRATGAFDAALLLAVIHHLTVTDGVPLAAVFRLLSRMVTKGAVAEYVPPDDPQFQRIVRNKEHLIPLLGQPEFEQAFSPWFFESGRVAVPGSGRVLYALSVR
jgi:SAM-dependent methyltransferase